MWAHWGPEIYSSWHCYLLNEYSVLTAAIPDYMPVVTFLANFCPSHLRLQDFNSCDSMQRYYVELSTTASPTVICRESTTNYL
jgi:hypothetical protein